jgi:hypothetical protein
MIGLRLAITVSALAPRKAIPSPRRRPRLFAHWRLGHGRHPIYRCSNATLGAILYIATSSRVRGTQSSAKRTSR